MSALLVIAAIALFLGLAGTAALIFALIYGVRRGVYALKGEPYRPLLGSGSKNAYQHQDVDAGSTSDSIASVFRHNLNVKGVAPYARSGMAALSSAERKSANYRAVLDSKFQPGSITWQKFAGADEATQQAVVRNCAELANAIQLFDYEDFSRSERARRAAGLAAIEGVRVWPSQGNFLLVRMSHAGIVRAHLRDRWSILVRDFSSAPGLEDCLRITVGTPAENDELMDAIASILREVA